MNPRNNQVLPENEDNSTFVTFIKMTIMADNKNKRNIIYIVYSLRDQTGYMVKKRIGMG